jgi:hypothetical protein
MSERIEGGVRIKFACERVGPREPLEDSIRASLQAMADGLLAMERAGCCPILDDGKSAGNGAILLDERLFVTPSGRLPGSLSVDRFVEVDSFDTTTWTARYRGNEAPTSDTPLYWLVLRELELSEPRPIAALHGHVWDTGRAAERLELPISLTETEFSTPADREALHEVIRAHPWPRHDTWIRRGHGFFCVGRSPLEVSERVLSLAQRAAALGLLDSGAEHADSKKL